MGCVVKLFLSTVTIGSWAISLLTSTAIWIQRRKSKSGLATRLIARISVGLTRRMEALSLSSRAASPGEEADDNVATVHFFNRNDRKSIRTQPARALTIEVPPVAG